VEDAIMSEAVDYNDSVIMDILKLEVCGRLGQEAWDALTSGIGIPDIRNEAKRGCRTMREFMKRLESMADKAAARDILTHVRHGLKRSQFAWAREKFARYNSIDRYIQACLDEEIEAFTRLRDTGGSFYGQPIDDAALQFILGQPGMLAPVRRGSELHVTAFPSNMVEYLKETDERRKRYQACHCPFARESILREGEEVSRTLCFCSLGHAKIMWEAIFDMELDGDVVQSVLGGDLLCRYVVYLPEQILEQYA
jgi:hypothetical protein